MIQIPITETNIKFALVGVLVGALILGIIWLIASRKKRIDLSDLKLLALEGAKDIHFGYDKLKRIYSIIEKSEKKGELVK